MDVVQDSQMDVTLNTGAVVRVVADTAGTHSAHIPLMVLTHLLRLSVATQVIVFSDEAGNALQDTAVPGFPNNLGDASTIEIDTSSPVTQFLHQMDYMVTTQSRSLHN